ncbi:endoglucanase 25-like [Argentina anserina]|uniref:endoglucanase 25-like n=1 Tax=Argentina anserina TaxID=57926 RepID=UPI0021767D0D|nr:endoglucanase 25-like [Potentilla anserina]
MTSSLGYQSPATDQEPVTYVHTLSEAGRLLPSASRWNSIEIDFNLAPQSGMAYESLPSSYSKSYDHNIFIRDRKLFKRCLYISVSIVILILALILLLRFLPPKHHYHGPSKNLTLALNQALTFYDAQKSGTYPQNSPVKFRGDSGLQDGNLTSNYANLVGGFYDSGNNIKFSFSTAYTMTLLSWTVIEYHQKYADIGELDHVKDIIKWGSDYLLKVFVPPNATSDTILYSQIGNANSDGTTPSDINCWERPEDMDYQRPVSVCDSSASDLAGEIVAALSAASLVFKGVDGIYSGELVKAAVELFESVTKDPDNQGTYTRDETCGGQSRDFYNSSGYKDELVWGGTWLFFATGDITYLQYATDQFQAAVDSETSSDKWIFDWNNKLTANMVLLTRLQFFHDLGYPYEGSLMTSANMTGSLMCSYVSNLIFKMTPGGLVIQRPNYGAPLQFAATASFLSKLYSDYLDLLLSSGGSCSTGEFTVDMLRSFSLSQVNYILGDNPMNLSYMVGFGVKFPGQVHHRSSSIPWDGQHYSCKEGYKWGDSRDPNPNVLLGAMVGGPDEFDKFIDERDKQEFTEPRIASNAGLVAALIALHDPPHTRKKKKKKGDSDPTKLGIDQMGIFDKIH